MVRALSDGILASHFSVSAGAAVSTYAVGMARRVELLWFADCSNHEQARKILYEVINQVAPGTPVTDIDATDPAVANLQRFPGSPTIRVDGADVEPGFVDPGNYAPRCRLFRTGAGLAALPEREWIEAALRGG